MKYRHYTNPIEMKQDFYQRMWEKDFIGDRAEWNPMTNPIIWIKGKDGSEYMILAFTQFGVIFNPPYIISWDRLFKEFCYLDDSPIGKEIEE